MRKKLLYSVLLLLCCILWACASGKEYYTQSLDLIKKGQLEEALAKLESAIEKEPGNDDYKEKLDSLKKEIVKNLLVDADKHLKFQRMLTLEALNSAKDKVNKAKKLIPDHKEATLFQNKLVKLEKRLEIEVERAYKNGLEKVKNEDWLSANKYFLEINQRYPGYKDSKNLLQETVTKGTNILFEKGKAFYDKEQFKDAKKYFSMVITLNPVHIEANDLYNISKEKDTFKYFIGEANNAKNEKNWERAVYAYNRALEYEPKNRSLKLIIPKIKKIAGSYYVEEAKGYISKGLLLKAFLSKEKSDKFLKRRDPERVSLNKEIIRQMMSAADQYKEEEKYGAALFWYNKVKAVNPRDRKIFYQIQSMRDKIRKRVIKSIAVYDFRSPVNNKDAGIIVSNSLITYLFKNVNKDVRILEREKLKSLIEEMQLGQTGVVSENTAQEMGAIQGVDTAIQGNVMLYNVESSKTKSEKTVSYDTGRTRIEDNIAYLNWKARNPDPSEEELQSAPPAKVRVPITEEKEYSVTTFQKVAFIQVNFHIIDVKTGKKIYVDTLKEKMTVTDTTNPGIPKAKIKEDPLEILTDIELLQVLTEKMTKQLGDKVLEPFSNLGQEYIASGDKYLNRREYFLAIEDYYNSFYNNQLKDKKYKDRTALNKVNDIFLNLSIKTSLMIQREKQERENQERLKERKALESQKEAQKFLEDKKAEEEKLKKEQELKAKEEAERAKAEALKQKQLEEEAARKKLEEEKKIKEEEQKKKASEAKKPEVKKEVKKN